MNGQLDALRSPPVGDPLARADTALSTAFEALDAALGRIEEPERGAALSLRADVADLRRRLGNLRLFADNG